MVHFPPLELSSSSTAPLHKILIQLSSLPLSFLKTLFKKIAASPTKPPPRMSIESGGFMFHYVIEGDVVYLVLVDKAYPKKLAFQYLDELSKEFYSLYGQQIDQVTRPYAFIKFDSFIQKTKKLYMDTRTQRNIERLNADIAEVHSIMTRNIQDVLGQGERLDRTLYPKMKINFLSLLENVGQEYQKILGQNLRTFLNFHFFLLLLQA